MNPIYADIELITGNDITLARRNIVSDENVKSIHVNMRVDTCEMLLAINEHIQEQLQLTLIGKKQVQLSNGHAVLCDVVGPIELRYKNRSTYSNAIVLPGNSTPQIRSILLNDTPVRLPIKMLPA